MDLLALYQVRLDKCAAEQFWMVALLASMHGFIIIKKQVLLDALSETILKAGIALATLFGIGYIISRHLIYVRYDDLVNQIIIKQAEKLGLLIPPTSGILKTAAVNSGVVFYGLIVLAMGIVSIRIIKS